MPVINALVFVQRHMRVLNNSNQTCLLFLHTFTHTQTYALIQTPANQNVCCVLIFNLSLLFRCDSNYTHSTFVWLCFYGRVLKWTVEQIEKPRRITYTIVCENNSVLFTRNELHGVLWISLNVTILLELYSGFEQSPQLLNIWSIPAYLLSDLHKWIHDWTRNPPFQFGK